MTDKFDANDFAPHPLDFSVDQRTFAVMLAARADCEKTEQQIADAGGISRGTVTKYFNGDVKNPQFQTVLRIWRGMGYDDNDLLRRVFTTSGPTVDTETADRIGSEAGPQAEIAYLKNDIRRLLEIIQDRLSENAYHKQEIAQMMDAYDSALSRQAADHERLVAELERENHRLFIGLWVAFGLLAAVLTVLALAAAFA